MIRAFQLWLIAAISAAAVCWAAPPSRPKSPPDAHGAVKRTSHSWPLGGSREREQEVLSALEELGAEHEVELDQRGKPFQVVTWNGGDDGIERLAELERLRWLDLS